MATKLAPKPARMPPYIIEAGPPFKRENWKVVATLSQPDCMRVWKAMAATRLMKRYEGSADRATASNNLTTNLQLSLWGKKWPILLGQLDFLFVQVGGSL